VIAILFYINILFHPNIWDNIYHFVGLSISSRDLSHYTLEARLYLVGLRLILFGISSYHTPVKQDIETGHFGNHMEWKGLIFRCLYQSSFLLPFIPL